MLGDAGTVPVSEFEPGLVAGDTPRAVALREGDSSGGKVVTFAGDGV